MYQNAAWIFLSVNYNSGAINNYVLDLNGYGIRYSGPDKDLSVIRVDGVTFTLEDNCTSPGTYYLINSFYYKNNAFRTGSVTKTAPTGTENVDYAVVTGGYITGGYTHIISGSGINVSGGKFEMRGGTVIGNASSVISNLGLGLSIGYGCKVYMHGGSIRLNGVHKIPGSAFAFFIILYQNDLFRKTLTVFFQNIDCAIRRAIIPYQHTKIPAGLRHQGIQLLCHISFAVIGCHQYFDHTSQNLISHLTAGSF